MGMPEPGRSTNVTGHTTIGVVAATLAIFVGWWLLFWASLDYLMPHSVFSTGDYRREADSIIFAGGLALIVTAVAGLVVWSLLRRLVRTRPTAAG